MPREGAGVPAARPSNVVLPAPLPPTRAVHPVEQVNDRSAVVNAVALNSTMFNIARVVGPGLGGVLIRGSKGAAKSTAVRALASRMAMNGIKTSHWPFVMPLKWEQR